MNADTPIRRPSLAESTPKSPSKPAENLTTKNAQKCKDSSENSSRHLEFLTNLTYEQQRAYNELFESYKEERERNIKLSKQIRKILVEITEFKSRSSNVSKNDFSCQTEIDLDTRAKAETSAISENASNVNVIEQVTTEKPSMAASMLTAIEHLRKEKHREFMLLTKGEHPPPVATAPAHIPAQNTQSKLDALRENKHARFLNLKSDSNVLASPSAPAPATETVSKDTPPNNAKPPRNKSHEWRDGVTLVVGDSTIGGLLGEKMFSVGEVKVKSHGGATVRDIYDHLEAHLSKKPTNVIVHIGTNNSDNQTSDEILNEMKSLNIWIKNYTKGSVHPIFSMPTVRYDRAKPTLTVRHLQAKLRNSGLTFIDNTNIEQEHLGKRKLHLNTEGTSLLASNMIRFLKSNN